MENKDNSGFSIYRPGNLIRMDGVALTAWPGNLCIPENLARVTPLLIDDLVLRHLGFKLKDNPLMSYQIYKRKINWPINIGEDKRQLEFVVFFKEKEILMGLKHMADLKLPANMIEVKFAHDLQNHYSAATGVDELNVLRVNPK